MSLPFDISEKLKSVQVRHYVEWLGRDSHCGYGFAFGYDEKSYRLIDELFQMLQDVETDDEDGAKELWLCARRGTIDDFAKQYGTYEENLEDGTVKNQKEYEDYWKSEFPDEVEWYRFVAVEHTDIKYRCVFLSNKQVSLYVGLGRVAEGCYHLALAAKSYGRCVEAIKFYLALKHAGLPVIIYGAEFIKKRLLGLERVGIVPNEVMPFYCHSRFPGEDVDSFRHLNHENPDAEIALIEWQPIKPVKLKENAHE